jgi:hypothetical protein
MIKYTDYYNHLNESLDDDYLLATNSNNKKLCQTMIDVAAQKNGYTFGPVSHKTNSNFNKIDFSKMSRSAVWGPAFYASFSNEIWNPTHLKNGKVLIGFVGGNILDGTKPLSDNDTKTISNLVNRSVDVIPFMTLEKRFGNIGTALLIAGYSSFIHEGPGGTGKHIAIFDSKMFKLSDPVTYDDNDEIIPLSKRFDVSSDDIRY